MQINKNKLISALKKVYPGISGKDLVKEYGCVSLTEDSISSFSERIIVSYPFDLPGINCLVDYGIFLKMLEKINSVDVELFQEKTELILRTERTESGFAIVDGEHPKINLPNNWNNIPEDLIDALNMCSFSMSKDMTIPSATCTHIHGKYVLSTDTKRITQYEMKEESPFDFHVPFAAISYLKNYNFVKMAKTDTLVHFLEDNGAIFSFYQMSLDRDITPEEAEKFFGIEGVEVEFPRDFVKVVERASVMTEGLIDLDYVIDITINNDKFIVRSQRENGRYKEEGDIGYKGKNVTFRVSAPFLFEILKRTNKCVIGDMCKFTGDRFKHVMVLIEN